MASITIYRKYSAAGENFIDDRTVTVDNVISASETSNMPAGKAGTAGAAGVMTLGSSHGFTDASVVCVSWSTGYRFDCAVSAYDGTTITVNGATGSGSTLPTAGAVVVSLKTEVALSFAGSNASIIMLAPAVDAVMAIEDGSSILWSASVTGGTATLYDSQDGATNPVASDTPTKCNCYNRTTTAGLPKILVGYNN